MAANQPSSTPPALHQRLNCIWDDFKCYAEESQANWQVPGMAIAVVSGDSDKPIYTLFSGVKRLGGGDPIDGQTVFQIGSASKAFTAALLAILVDEGKVNWTDRVVDHIPGFEMYDPWVTREFQVRDLMAQHSGMQPNAGDMMAYIGMSRDYIESKIRFMKPFSSFRADFGYVNNLSLVAADLIERKSEKKTWAEIVEEKIFGPLGMESSTVMFDSFRKAPNVASPHKWINGKVTALETDAPRLSWVYTYAPAGGVNSTLLDMARWVRMLLGKGSFEGTQIMSPENLGFVLSPQTVLSKRPGSEPLAPPILTNYPRFYCEGWFFFALQPCPLIWHTGDTNFMHSAVALIPDANLGIVFLTNLGWARLVDALVLKFYDLYFQQFSDYFHNQPGVDWSKLYDEKCQEEITKGLARFAKRPEGASPPQPLSRYTGTFHNSVYGDLNVDRDPNCETKLRLIVGPSNMTIELEPWNRDTFVASQPGHDAFFGESGFVSFAFGGQGNVESITLDAISDVDDCRFVIREK
jgi:CubicO group peptidase (beta-lactamase class C family)